LAEEAAEHEGRRDDVLPGKWWFTGGLMGFNQQNGGFNGIYPAWLCQTKSYGKWPFIVDFPIKNGDFPVRYVNLPEGTSTYCMVMAQSCWLIM